MVILDRKRRHRKHFLRWTALLAEAQSYRTILKPKMYGTALFLFLKLNTYGIALDLLYEVQNYILLEPRKYGTILLSAAEKQWQWHHSFNLSESQKLWNRSLKLKAIFCLNQENIEPLFDLRLHAYNVSGAKKIWNHFRFLFIWSSKPFDTALLLKYKIYGTVFSCILRSKLMEPLFNCHYFISHFDHFTP